MDEFEVRAKSTNILQTSHLVEEMRQEASTHRSFPVVINGLVRTFHEIEGGYDEDSGYHLVKLVQKHDHMATKPRDIESSVYEVHLDSSFLLYIDDIHTFNSDEAYTIALRVGRYDRQEASFKEVL